MCQTLPPLHLRALSWNRGPSDPSKSCAASPQSRPSPPPPSPPSSSPPPPPRPPPRLRTNVGRQRSKTPSPSSPPWPGARSLRRGRASRCPACTRWTRTSPYWPPPSRRRSSRRGGGLRGFRPIRVNNQHRCHRNDFSINNFLHCFVRSFLISCIDFFSFLCIHTMHDESLKTKRRDNTQNWQFVNPGFCLNVARD